MTDTVQAPTGAEEVIWDLSALYANINDPAIDADLAAAQAEADRFAEQYRGKIAALSAAELAQAMRAQESLNERVGKMLAYANLEWNTDTTNPAFGALLQRLREASSQINQKTLFFELEWTQIPDERAHTLLSDPVLARWRHYLKDLLKYRPHQLSEPEEKILSEKSVTGSGAWMRFFSEVVNSIEYDWEGKKVPQAVVLRALYLPDRETRKRAADSVTAGLRTQLRPITYIFNTLLAEKASDDRLRRYPSWISSRNLANETTDEAVEALVQAVTARYDIVARYYRLKRQLLGLDTLYDYDRYAQLPGADSHYHWNDARDIVLKAFGAFHPHMGAIAQEFFDKRWIHAPVKPGKRGGAFSAPTVPSAHPFVFLNYTGVVREVMTLAHELGHGIHQYLARPHGVFGAYTPLTTAEMASVFGEMLVFDDLMTRESNPAVRLSMLASKIEDTFATVFRQISMNRFEDAIHTARRTEGELTTERFNQLWMETQRAMFGDSVTLRDDYSIWWSYVSHFISVPGYVYAYAFGELLVLALFNRYKREGQAFAPRYLEVLAAGGSDSPEAILAKVGVDLTDPAFWQEGLNTIAGMVDQLEALAKTVKE